MALIGSSLFFKYLLKCASANVTESIILCTKTFYLALSAKLGVLGILSSVLKCKLRNCKSLKTWCIQAKISTSYWIMKYLKVKAWNRVHLQCIFFFSFIHLSTKLGIFHFLRSLCIFFQLRRTLGGGCLFLPEVLLLHFYYITKIDL